VDERSDVFGLGAILCVILTGDPPYTGPDAKAIRLMAVRGDLLPCHARLAACGADPGWVSLCQRCLSFDPDDRPRTAGEVAESVTRLRAKAEQRAQAAVHARVRAEAETREQRKRRRVQLALAVAVGLLLLGGGAVAWWRYDVAVKREEADRQRQQAEQRAIAERELALHYEGLVYFYTARLLIPSGKATNPTDLRYAAKYLETAVDRFETATREFPDNPSHRYYLGWAYRLVAMIKVATPLDPAAVEQAHAYLDKAEPLILEFESEEARASLTFGGKKPATELAPHLRNLRQCRLWAYIVGGRHSEALILFDQLYPEVAAAAAETPFRGEPDIPTHLELETLIGTDAPFGFDIMTPDRRQRVRVILLRAAEEEQSRLLISGKAKDDFPKTLRLAEALAAARGVVGPAVYNAACAYALGTAQPGIDGAERDRRAARAIEYLRRLHVGGYFEHPTKAASRRRDLETDTDLDALRGRDDFRALLAAVRADATAPPPREVNRRP
jgi:hypothetical protein